MKLELLTKDGIAKVLTNAQTLYNEISSYVNDNEYDTLTPDTRAYLNAVLTNTDDLILILTQLDELIKLKKIQEVEDD